MNAMNRMDQIEAAKRTKPMIAVDTATRSMTVAVVESGRLLGERNDVAERNHSMYLVPSMQKLLQTVNRKPDQLGAIAVGIGPGSYTGVRIGISVAKTMAWALNLPLVGISSLEAMALGGMRRFDSHDGETVWVVPLMDARRGNVFTGLYTVTDVTNELASLHNDSLNRDFHKLLSFQWGGEGTTDPSCGIRNKWECVISDGIQSMEQWTAQLAGLLNRATETKVAPDVVLFVGEVAPFVKMIDQFAAAAACRVSALPHDLRAVDIARLAYPKWLSGEWTDSHRIVPNYTQPPEAEVKLLLKLRAQKGE